MTLVHRATTVGDEMAKIIKTPAIPRNPDNPDRLADGTNGNCESPALSESQSKTSTIAEINSYPIVETQSENIVESPSDTVMVNFISFFEFYGKFKLFSPFWVKKKQYESKS